VGGQGRCGTLRSTCARRPAALDLRPLWREVALVTALLVIYNAGRLLAATRVSGAFDNAHLLLGLERRLHLPYEQTLQSVVLALPDLARAANGYYAGVHFPLTFAVLVWLFLRRPAHYLWARRSLVAATAAGLVITIALPTAPPRMMTGYGFVDTGLAFGLSVYGAVGQDKLANQFAALPSLHVGWSLLIAVVCIRASRTRWRWLWLAHPVLTVLVVVVTGNHYWIDGALGIALVTVALVLTRGALTSIPAQPVPAPAAPVLPPLPAQRRPVDGARRGPCGRGA
jgi:hypothetical protein